MDNLWELVLLFHVGSRDRAQVISFAAVCLPVELAIPLALVCFMVTGFHPEILECGAVIILGPVRY